MQYPDLTLITNSFNTPHHFSTMLKSFIHIHGDGPHNILICENSTNDETQKILDANNIGYLKTPGGTHSRSIDRLLLTCNTQYALLVDSDIIFLEKIDKLLDIMKTNNATLMGEISGDRGGYTLHQRIHPWFCLINVDHIRKNKIKFHDQKKIDDTNSNYFYEAVPINPFKGNIRPFYDVGSTFYEEINNKKLKILDAKGIQKYFKHFEGSSWHRQSGNEAFMAWGNKVYQEFTEAAKQYESIDIKSKFIHRINFDIETKKIICIQPIFCPDASFFESNKNSILSIIDYQRQFPYNNIKFIFGGYCKEDQYWNEINEIVTKNNFGICKRFDKNYGKAYTVNSLFKEFYTDEPYMLTLDSDIILDITEYDMFRRLIAVANDLPIQTNHSLGMLALNQKNACCHIMQMMDRQIIVNNEILKWSSNGCGMAGGCLFINTDSFKKINGYRVMGVYSGDDGYLHADMNRINAVSMITTTISVIHPPNYNAYDEKYLKWKHAQLEQCRQHSGRPLTETELEINIKETANNWNTGFVK